MPNDGYFDLSGVFHVQTNYLTDLSNSYPDVNNAPLVATYVHELQDKIIQVADGYNAANTSANAVLDQQHEMLKIIDTEQTRLDEKKASIDSALATEARKTLLTNSQRLRAAEYTKILIVIVIGLCIHIGLRLFSNTYITEESSNGARVTILLLHIANFITCGIIILNIYFTIQSRSQINFNELVIAPPNTTTSGGTTPPPANYDNILGDLGICEETTCCGTGTIWDPSSNTCVALPVQATLPPIPQYTPSPTSASPSPTPSPSVAPPTTGIAYMDTAFNQQMQLQQASKVATAAIPTLKQRQQMFRQAAARATTSPSTTTPAPSTTKPPTATTQPPLVTTKPPLTAEGFSTYNVNRAVYLPGTSSHLMPQNTTNVCGCGNETNNFGFLPGNYKDYYVSYK